jgi:hypothetical protein
MVVHASKQFAFVYGLPYSQVGVDQPSSSSNVNSTNTRDSTFGMIRKHNVLICGSSDFESIFFDRGSFGVLCHVTDLL